MTNFEAIKQTGQKERHFQGDQDMSELLNAEQVAKQFGFNTKSIYRLAYRRRLPFVKLGDNIRFRQEDIDRYIAEHVLRDIKRLKNNKNEPIIKWYTTKPADDLGYNLRLITIWNFVTSFAFFKDGKWINVTNNHVIPNSEIIAWAYLPAPYKPEAKK